MSVPSFEVVCVSLTSYTNAFTKSTVELMNELARHHRVLYVDFAVSVKDLVTGRLRNGWKKVVGLDERLARVELSHGGTLHVLTPPPVLPVNWMQPGVLHGFAQGFNTYWLAAEIRAAMKRLAFDRPVVINAFHPINGLALAGRLNERALVYYCYDDIYAESWSRHHGPLSEAALIRQADAVIASSRELQLRKTTDTTPCYLLENGVDYPLFQQAFHLPTPKPVQTVGYIGAIDNRLDLDLLGTCFQRFPEVQFQFVGRQPDAAIRAFFEPYANVTLSPPVAPSQLPAFVETFDAALIPFVCNQQTKAIYPLKVNEYLAAGLPVVSTLFSDLSDFAGVVALADSPEDFCEALKGALADTRPEEARKRSAFARTNSWEERGKRLEQILGEVLRDKR
ncbi:glycosyltransferase [Tellurirhabdus rosea]|uniref:glycosyltransferase n=1 Tax=Tellurirhabdus rosea TaxID=2674997 RepID=UPI0022554BA3|nr:glycosyltransferase [Tellurirhabdus rosea]